jgi:hypothetical protein
MTDTVTETVAERIDSDNFQYLGKLGPVFLFLRVDSGVEPTSAEVTQQMCVQVYNTLIQEAMVQRGDSLLVFNIRGDSPVVTPVHVRHADFAELAFPDEALAEALRKGLTAERDPEGKRLVLRAVFETRAEPPVRYDIFSLPESVLGAAGDVSTAGLEFAPVTHMGTTKPIPYL